MNMIYGVFIAKSKSKGKVKVYPSSTFQIEEFDSKSDQLDYLDRLDKTTVSYLFSAQNRKVFEEKLSIIKINFGNRKWIKENIEIEL